MQCNMYFLFGVLRHKSMNLPYTGNNEFTVNGIPENYNILVAKGQRVVGGETIISNPNNIQNIKTSILK